MALRRQSYRDPSKGYVRACVRACNGPDPGGGPGLIKERSRASGWQAAEAEVAGVGEEEQRTTASASGRAQGTGAACARRPLPGRGQKLGRPHARALVTC